jgi:molybdopterin-guanine dinucleotide biosynthesis protein A
VDACILNANGDDTAFRQFGLPIVADAFEGYAGPLAGLLSGMIWAAKHRPDARHIVTAPCDTPFLPGDYVSALVDAAGGEEGTIVVAASGGRVHFASGLWPVALADDLEAFLRSGERRTQSWLERHPNRSVTFPPIDNGGTGFDPFFNVNTPEDLSAAEAFAGERGE